MHDFLIDIKQWHNSENFQTEYSKFKTKEAACIADCPDSDKKCVQLCKKQRAQINSFIYQKESQFIRMIYKQCY